MKNYTVKYSTISSVIVVLTFIQNVCAQKMSSLEIGKPMPDFTLSDVQYYRQPTASLKDFKGKWLVLDFWNMYCYNCVASQPKMDSLRKTFINRNVEMILVGYTGSQYLQTSDNLPIRALFEKSRSVNKLSIPIAYDSLIMEKYSIKPTPYIVIITPEGQIKAITTNITESSLERLMTGDTVTLRKAYLRGETKKAQQDRSEGGLYSLYNKIEEKR